MPANNRDSANRRHAGMTEHELRQFGLRLSDLQDTRPVPQRRATGLKALVAIFRQFGDALRLRASAR